MALIRIGGFQGEYPRVHPRFLPEGAAQQALNIRFDSGALESLKNTTFSAVTSETAPISLFRYSDTIWLEAESDVDWVRYPVVDDAYGRVIFTDPDDGKGPQVTDATIVGSGGYPLASRPLDVPAPTSGPSATLQGQASTEDDVPETRFYVVTFVNEYGAEGPPSPVSNEVEWRDGQTVLIENIPSSPGGTYNITYRRLYRVNTGSSTNTEFQFVTELAILDNPKTITAITQANPVVITTSESHALTTGTEVTIAGLGLQGTAKAVTAASRTNPVVLGITAHGFTSGQYVELDGFTTITGMSELQGVRARVDVINTNQIRLTGVDGTGFAATPAYSSGGTAQITNGMDELNGNQYFVSVVSPTQLALTGIDGTGFVQYFNGGTATPVFGSSYVDGVPSGSLGEVLPTEIYDPPNAATVGLKEHPSGFLVGFYGKTVAFSEIGAPHAWPIDYRLVTSHDIVGLGIFGNTVVITTKGWPYMAVGSDPSAMTMVELELDQACVAKRGIVDFGAAIVYPSPDGLIMMSPQGAQNVTQTLFERDQWQALNPSSFVAFNWESHYLCFYNDGSTQRTLIINPFDPASGVRYVALHMDGGYRDIEEDLLYVINDNQIEKWDQGTALEYKWKSKPTFLPHSVNMAAAKIIADGWPVFVEFYVDDVRHYFRWVYSSEAFRLPGGFSGEKFEVRISGTKRVSQVSMATTMRELAATV